MRDLSDLNYLDDDLKKPRQNTRRAAGKLLNSLSTRSKAKEWGPHPRRSLFLNFTISCN